MGGAIFVSGAGEGGVASTVVGWGGTELLGAGVDDMLGL